MRAILLAAGMGTRLRPLTLETPKSLIQVNGKPLLERQIEFLKEKGINEIIIVSGYLKEKFEYLIDKYEVKLVYIITFILLCI
jgi:L-glutamine-phosphate cytidylyltransferase